MNRRLRLWLMLTLALIVIVWLYSGISVSQYIIDTHNTNETRQRLTLLLAAMVENAETSLESVVHKGTTASMGPWLHDETSAQYLDCRNFWLGYGISSAVHPCPGEEAHYLLSDPATRQPLAVFDMYLLAAHTMDHLRQHCSLPSVEFDMVPISSTVTHAGTHPRMPEESASDICAWVEQPSDLDQGLKFYASGCTTAPVFKPYAPLWFFNALLGLVFLLIMAIAVAVIGRRAHASAHPLPAPAPPSAIEEDDRDMEVEEEVVRRTQDLRFVVRTIKDILDSIPSGLLVLDSKMRVVMANLGFYHILQPEDESIRRQPVEDILPQHVADLATRCQESRKAFLDREIKLSATKRHGRLMLNVSVIPLSGKTRRMLMVLDNVTERRKLEEELRLQERLAGLGTLIAGVSHEINNPLNAVVGLVEVMLSTEQLTPSATEHMTLIQKYARRIADIVQDLNRYSRTAKTTEKIPTDLNELMQDALALVRRSQPYIEHVSIETELDDNLPRAMVNPADISQVLVNLLTNSVDALQQKATSHGENAPAPYIPVMRVGSRVRMNGPRAVIELAVEDNGPGISPEIRSHIFDPFFSTKSHGTGLGLAISRRILEDCGASIDVSTEPGDHTRIALLFEAPPARGDTQVILSE